MADGPVEVAAQRDVLAEVVAAERADSNCGRHEIR